MKWLRGIVLASRNGPASIDPVDFPRMFRAYRTNFRRYRRWIIELKRECVYFIFVQAIFSEETWFPVFMRPTYCVCVITGAGAKTPFQFIEKDVACIHGIPEKFPGARSTNLAQELSEIHSSSCWSFERAVCEVSRKNTPGQFSGGWEKKSTRNTNPVK